MNPGFLDNPGRNITTDGATTGDCRYISRACPEALRRGLLEKLGYGFCLPILAVQPAAR
ncbi:hypothetical protein QUB75_06135 [Microcoleus sp. K1-B6]|uniref:hypothetical protein n=1 Tax=Microcoleus sp. K1-B1 TaxID=2818782 RepID=UPI002FD05A10